jgi:hypothetical protein
MVQAVQTVEIKTLADEQWFHVQPDRDELYRLVAHSWADRIAWRAQVGF